jgi:putative ABC transport system ATP-binding protein
LTTLDVETLTTLNVEALSQAETPDRPLLHIDGLRFRWPKASEDTLAIERLTMKPGETVFLRGPSGCGKSTLLALVAGVLTAQHGCVEVSGQDWTRLSPAQRDKRRADHVGYIFQQFNLLPYLSVLDNVLLPCRFSTRRAQRAGVSAGTQSTQVATSAIRESAQDLLHKVGLPTRDWRRPASELSVGQQQRVAAARALIGQPELVIADEPTSALDEALRESFMDLLLEACSQAGSALLFVSHDERLATRFMRQLDLQALNAMAHPSTATA